MDCTVITSSANMPLFSLPPYCPLSIWPPFIHPLHLSCLPVIQLQRINSVAGGESSGLDRMDAEGAPWSSQVRKGWRGGA